MDALKTVLVPMHREGRRFVALFAAVTVVLFLISAPLGWAGVVLTAWCVYFFRDPTRYTPTREGLIVSPGDGRVQAVVDAVPPAELEMGSEPRPRISIFLNIFDVHVNRVPADGVVTKVHYHPGTFVNAALDKASEDNERQSVRMTTAEGKDIAFVQIAGLVARRIVCDIYEGREVKAGERYGLIRFGSRVDVYLDKGIAPLVAVGQRAIGGETVLADQRSEERRRSGEAR
jgi:phosphatidylserine decarboxylase